MTPKRMLFVCPTGFGTAKNGVDLGLALRAFGNEVTFFDIDWKPVWLRSTPKPLRWHWWEDASDDAVNNTLVRQIEATRPEIVFFLSGFQVAPATLLRIRELGLKTVGYWVDDPLDHSRAITKAHLYDLFLTNDRSTVPRYIVAGVSAIRHFPSAANEERFFPIENAERVADLSFVGTHSPYREAILRNLLDYDLKVFGPGWTKNSSLPARVTAEGAFGERTNLVYNGSRINLNIHNWFGVGSAMNLRLFEVLCAGQFLLTDWVAEIEGNFVEDEHIACFRDVAELKRKIDWYLDHDAERAVIAARGRAHVLARHTYHQRAGPIDGWCDDLLAGRLAPLGSAVA